MYYCKESGPIPSHPVQLDEGFTSWLEKLSTNLEEQSEKAVIIIDSVDLITVRPSLSLSLSLSRCYSPSLILSPSSPSLS